MGEILKIAPSITTPIAFAALALLVVYLVTRQLLQMNVFSNVGQKHSAGIIIRIVNRLFLLALIVSVLVFVFSIMPAVLEYLKSKPRPTPASQAPTAEQAAGAAEKLLKSFYAKDAEALYQALPSSLQQNFGLGGSEKAMQREAFQLPGAPISRRPHPVEILSGYALVRFDAEFDQVSTWLESLTFVSQGTEWRLWNITVVPQARVLTSQSDLLPFQNLEQFLAGEETASLIGRWTPLPGWTASVVSVEKKVANRTCNVSVEGGAQSRARLTKVLGACELKPGTRIVFIGEFSGLSDTTREFTNVRYYPA